MLDHINSVVLEIGAVGELLIGHAGISLGTQIRQSVEHEPRASQVDNPYTSRRLFCSGQVESTIKDLNHRKPYSIKLSPRVASFDGQLKYTYLSTKGGSS